MELTIIDEKTKEPIENLPKRFTFLPTYATVDLVAGYHHLRSAMKTITSNDDIGQRMI